MDQQLIHQIVQIDPNNMDALLSKIQSLLSTTIQQPSLLNNIVKSLFYGLWNFDKPINQHRFNSRIAQLFSRLPENNGLLFLQSLLEFLQKKWNLIDHHRINKFMQLVSYLLVEAYRLGQKIDGFRSKVDQILLKEVFLISEGNNGLAQHIVDVSLQSNLKVISRPLSLNDLLLFQRVLLSHPNEHFRLYLMEHVYEKYKKYLCDIHSQLLEKVLAEFSNHFLQLAKKEENQTTRKNLYNLVGFAKSTQLSFYQYLAEKKEKRVAEQEKKKKKISKGKKEEVKTLKTKRKLQRNKPKKIESLRKFQKASMKFDQS